MFVLPPAAAVTFDLWISGCCSSEKNTLFSAARTQRALSSFDPGDLWGLESPDAASRQSASSNSLWTSKHDADLCYYFD